jgi:NDP-sugar pyrophosphorylase family protein
MALVPHPRPDRDGGVIVERGRVVRFVPRGAPGESFHFIGVQLVEADVFAGLPDGVPAESVSGVYRGLLGDDPSSIAAYVSDAPFHDIGTPGDYLATSLVVARAEGLGDRLPPGRGARIDPGARLVRTAVWDDVEIGPDVELTDCIVGDGASVPAGTRLAGRVLVPATGTDAPDGAARLGGLFVSPLSEDDRA